MIDIILAGLAVILTIGVYLARNVNKDAHMTGLMLMLAAPVTATAMGQGLTLMLFAYCMGTGMVLFLMWMFRGV